MSSPNAKKSILKALQERGYSFNEHVIKAFFEVDRALFLMQGSQALADQDTPFPIPKGQTISAIHMVLIMLAKDYANPKPGDNVLEVGTGSGYNAALLSKSIHAPNNGTLTTIEYYSEVYDFARKNLKNAGLLDTMTVVLGDGSKGYPGNAPYDIILVTAAAPQVPPPLIEQLAIPGKLVIPVGLSRYSQDLIVITKTKNGITRKNMGGVIFVPLRGAYGIS